MANLTLNFVSPIRRFSLRATADSSNGVPFTKYKSGGPVIMEIPLDKIRRPLMLTRANDPDKVKELMDSIREIGLQEPVHTICHKAPDSILGEKNYRRDVLSCFGIVIGMEIISSLGPFTEKSGAADLIQRRQRSEFLSNIKETLNTAIKGNPELIPSILTLALNDAMTYDKATKSGGPNGSIHFSSEINRPENSGLSPALSLLEEVKKKIDSYSKGGPISYADLIPLGAQAALKYTFLASAIRKCGGNEEKGKLLYAAYGSNGQWGLFDKQFGRADSQEPDPDGRILQWDKASVKDMKDKFSAVGFGPRQLAVMSAFLGPDQLSTETSLASDQEVLPWVQKYQRSRETVSQTDYEVDLITTLTKISCMAQKINYEAYTYPVPKVDLRKLKL